MGSSLSRLLFLELRSSSFLSLLEEEVVLDRRLGFLSSFSLSFSLSFDRRLDSFLAPSSFSEVSLGGLSTPDGVAGAGAGVGASSIDKGSSEGSSENGTFCVITKSATSRGGAAVRVAAVVVAVAGAEAAPAPALAAAATSSASYLSNSGRDDKKSGSSCKRLARRFTTLILFAYNNLA